MVLSAPSHAQGFGQSGRQVARQSAAVAAPLKSAFGAIIPDAPLPSDLAKLLLALRDKPSAPCEESKGEDQAP